MAEKQMTTFFAQIPEETYQKILKRSLSEGKNLAQVANEAFDCFFDRSFTRDELLVIAEALVSHKTVLARVRDKLHGSASPGVRDRMEWQIKAVRALLEKVNGMTP